MADIGSDPTPLPEPAATIHRLAEKLREDLAFAAPELWALRIERRLTEAYEAGVEDEAEHYRD